MLRRRSLRGRRGRHSLWILWSRRTQMVLAFERTLTVCRADRPYSFSAAKTCLKPPFSSFMAFEWPFDVCGHCTKWCFVKIHIHKPDISWILYIGTGSGPPCFIGCLPVPFTYIILAIVHIESWLQFRHAHFFDKYGL